MRLVLTSFLFDDKSRKSEVVIAWLWLYFPDEHKSFSCQFILVSNADVRIEMTFHRVPQAAPVI